MSASKFRILLIEDQGMMRAFFERWLAGLARFDLVATARSGEEALQLLETARPDLALVDYQLPGMDGLAFTQAARQMRPQLRTLIVTSLVDPLTLTRVHESGVEGYLEKDADPDLLAKALETVADGNVFYSSRFREILSQESSKSQAMGKILSRREQQVLARILEGKANKEIAETMGLSLRTVEFHRANLMAKLNASNLTELLANARGRGWAI